MRRLVPIAFATTALLAASACDTGDGKTLRPIDPDTTTTSTVAPPVDTGTLPSIPIEDADAGAGVAEPDDAGFRLFAPWAEGAEIDTRNTCDGDDISPAVSWTGPPDGTVELAFSLVDESAFDDGEPFTHWVIAGIDPADVSLIEAQVPVGAVQATNSFGTVGWSGPCPPPGEPAHVYRLTMYALNQQSEVADGTPANEMLNYLADITIDSTELIGNYSR